MPKQRIPDRDRTEGADGDPASTDDVLAFRAAVRDVKPLPKSVSPGRIAKPKPKTRTVKPVREPVSLDESMPLIHAVDLEPGQGIAAEHTITGSDVLAFQRAGVRTQVVRRLRRGLIPVEDELDLHGLSQSAAREHLAEFISHSRNSGRRCVRVIHGKGYRSGMRGPVLKMAVDSWLKRHLDVMAFTSARTIDGGTGAVYVLLRA